MNKPGSQVDLTNCDREPIHLLGGIQLIGFLIAVSIDWIIVRPSTNVGDFIGHGHAELIGRPMAESRITMWAKDHPDKR